MAYGSWLSQGASHTGHQEQKCAEQCSRKTEQLWSLMRGRGDGSDTIAVSQEPTMQVPGCLIGGAGEWLPLTEIRIF